MPPSAPTAACLTPASRSSPRRKAERRRSRLQRWSVSGSAGGASFTGALRAAAEVQRPQRTDGAVGAESLTTKRRKAVRSASVAIAPSTAPSTFRRIARAAARAAESPPRKPQRRRTYRAPSARAARSSACSCSRRWSAPHAARQFCGGVEEDASQLAEPSSLPPVPANPEWLQ